jgi:hypothetical protein
MRRVLALTGAAALVLAGAGTALASIPDGSGVIHGCYSVKGGALSVIDSATKTCPRGTTALDWSQTGPQGPQGPQGSPGPSTAGPSGLNVIIVRGQSALGGLGAQVLCPADHPYALGGGGASSYSPLMATGPVADDAGTTPIGWSASQEFGSTAAAVSVYAICAK